MLKNEIRTLNNEMSLLQYKLKTADKGNYILPSNFQLLINLHFFFYN